MSLVSAQTMFLPPENIQKFNKEVADFFLRKAMKEKEDKKLQMFCLDKAFGFMYDKENLELAANWVMTGDVSMNGMSLEAEITTDQKYAIIEKLYSSPYFDTDFKKELKEKIFEGDDSDKGKNT